jgi:hypothetical protein
VLFRELFPEFGENGEAGFLHGEAEIGCASFLIVRSLADFGVLTPGRRAGWLFSVLLFDDRIPLSSDSDRVRLLDLLDLLDIAEG